jgi:hypothetical protein
MAGFLAPVPGHQVGGDAEQPRPQAAASRVEPGSVAECHEEGLGGDLIGRLGVQPPGHIAVDIAEVPVIHGREQFRVSLEPGGELGIGRRPANIGGHVPGSVMRLPLPE